MDTLNPLPPAKRESNRYLVYDITAGGPVSGEEMGKAIWASALSFLGELGVSRSGMRVVDFDEKKQKGVVKVNRGSVDEGRMVLALVKEAGRQKVALRVAGVSGILKKARGKWA